MRIALVNETDKSAITDPIVDRMVAALNLQGSHFAAIWQRAVIEVYRAENLGSVNANDCPIGLLLDADAPGVLGYHTLTALGRPAGRAFWGPVMAAGGDPLTGAEAFAVTVSHEYLEVCGDPYASLWADSPDGEEEAHEICDRVEGDGYELMDNVWGSNFLGPRAFNAAAPGSRGGRYDWLGKLHSAWGMTPGGYRIRRIGGPGGMIRNDLADRSRWTEAKIAAKRSELARTARRGCVFA